MFVTSPRRHSMVWQLQVAIVRDQYRHQRDRELGRTSIECSYRLVRSVRLTEQPLVPWKQARLDNRNMWVFRREAMVDERLGRQ